LNEAAPGRLRAIALPALSASSLRRGCALLALPEPLDSCRRKPGTRGITHRTAARTHGRGPVRFVAFTLWSATVAVGTPALRASACERGLQGGAQLCVHHA
jgi:hypothetical protein